VTGASDVNRQLEFIASEILKLTTKVSRPLQLEGAPEGPTEDEQALVDLCHECSLVSKDLLNRLEGLRVKKDGKLRNWQSLQKAIEAAWAKDEVDLLVTRLSGFKEMINMRILIGLRCAENRDLFD
jgi:hypothetical protein